MAGVSCAAAYGEVWLADLKVLRLRSGWQTPLRSQQIFDVLFPIERRKIVELFAGADEARGNSKFILDRHHNAAFAAAIEFGHDQASESKRVVELACLT